jgi:hypothetical protein
MEGGGSGVVRTVTLVSSEKCFTNPGHGRKEDSTETGTRGYT